MTEVSYDISTIINEFEWESMQGLEYAVDYAVEMYYSIHNYFQPKKYLAIEFPIEFPIDSPGLKEFYQLAQNRIPNLLHKKITERIKNPAQLDLMGNRTYEDEKTGFKLFIKRYSELKNGVNQSAVILLDSLMIVATKNGLRDTLVKLSLTEYMTMRGLKNEKETRKQVKRDITALERISFEYQCEGKANWLKAHIAGGTSGIINGTIIFRFNEDFFNSFRKYEKGNYPFMYFPCSGLQININNHPYSYWLLRKISEHKRMNIGKSNEDVISVRTLIDACPNYPTYKYVMESNRGLTKRIIDPFERDMEALEEFFSWQYNSTEATSDYKKFIAATVTIYWRNYPDTPETRKLIVRKKARGKKLSIAKNKKKRGGSD